MFLADLSMVAGAFHSPVKRTQADTAPHSTWPTQRSMNRCVSSFIGCGLCQRRRHAPLAEGRVTGQRLREVRQSCPCVPR